MLHRQQAITRLPEPMMTHPPKACMHVFNVLIVEVSDISHDLIEVGHVEGRRLASETVFTVKSLI